MGNGNCLNKCGTLNIINYNILIHLLDKKIQHSEKEINDVFNMVNKINIPIIKIKFRTIK